LGLEGFSYDSIFRDVPFFGRDPANECLVTGLFRIALGKDQKTLFGAATSDLSWPSSRKPQNSCVFA